MMEHPDIESALLTGYPRRYTRIATRTIIQECDSCGEPLTNSEWFIEVGGERLCDSCVKMMKSDPSDAIIEQEIEYEVEE